MRIWCISDSHGFHEQLIEPDNIDMIIHAGDESNSKARAVNCNEAALFLNYYENLKQKYKIFVAGNHSTAIEAKQINPRDFPSIIYLDHESIEIEGIKIFGSPFTPSFGVGWAFNKDRAKLHELWADIPTDTDIVVTHGPPIGMLDLSIDRNNNLENCGDRSLWNHLTRRVKPKYSVFGHIHNYSDDLCVNQGIRIHNGITYINASCVTDGEFDKGLTSNGVIIEI